MKTKLAGYGTIGLALLFITLLICIGFGSVPLPAGEIVAIMLHRIPGIGNLITPDWSVSSEQIVMQVRLPRVLLGMLVGASLSVAGAAFQGVLRNPLADPFTLGVSSGSAVGAAVLIFFGWQFSVAGVFTLPLVAFFTGAVTLWIVMWLARENGKIPIESLILSGVVMQSFLGAIVSFLTAMSKKTINEIMYWTMGSLSLRGWSYTAILLPYLALGVLFLWSRSRTLNLLALGEREAAHSGLNVESTKLIILLVATLMTAAAVSVSGVIGFVGLVVPHMIRLITGPDYRLIIPLSALGGGIFMMWSDLAARSLLAPTEIPLGVVTAFVGAPFFAYLLYRKKKAREVNMQ
ncbi:iron complex transport system permease protein [Fontibacillus solani]|uniref:Iron complex transport system permease protein n=2 Tax=Fontibacillus TaxID=995014 RepID=A0A1G7PXS1_9BACL|nr:MULTISPECIES: iron ABC transporter permease [Fontibacillus]MBA9085877.1 iron complex transport system permease protein [Fontibacillus solani]SDF91023.1 iron complex transport system permease protein [Fontibacillus panacisegetis]